ALARRLASSVSANVGIPAPRATGMLAAVFRKPRRPTPLQVFALNCPNSSMQGSSGGMEEQKEAGEDAWMIGGMRGGGQGCTVPFILLHHHWQRLSIHCQAG
ncbi:hypothetical protein N9248_00175, partial [bacterium]|nr:hypothetical protein [bacterium]